MEFSGVKNREVKHTVDDLAFAICTRKAAFQDLPGLWCQPGHFWVFEKQIEVPYEGLERCPKFVGDGHHDSPAPFIIVLDLLRKFLSLHFLGNLDQKREDASDT